MELLEKLAVLVPPPNKHLLTYHGVLSSAATWRKEIVPGGQSTTRRLDHQGQVGHGLRHLLDAIVEIVGEGGRGPEIGQPRPGHPAALRSGRQGRLPHLRSADDVRRPTRVPRVAAWAW